MSLSVYGGWYFLGQRPLLRMLLSIIQPTSGVDFAHSSEPRPMRSHVQVNDGRSRELAFMMLRLHPYRVREKVLTLIVICLRRHAFPVQRAGEPLPSRVDTNHRRPLRIKLYTREAHPVT